ncbi:MAG TPA: hypothetical protein VGK47_05180, partial [Nitrososphaeraceae archaeon]
ENWSRLRLLNKRERERDSVKHNIVMMIEIKLVDAVGIIKTEPGGKVAYEQLEDISGQVDRGQKRYIPRQPS